MLAYANLSDRQSLWMGWWQGTFKGFPWETLNQQIQEIPQILHSGSVQLIASRTDHLIKQCGMYGFEHVRLRHVEHLLASKPWKFIQCQEASDDFKLKNLLFRMASTIHHLDRLPGMRFSLFRLIQLLHHWLQQCVNFFQR